MPRKARKDIIASYIHIITQGIKKEYIFNTDVYKREYMKLVREKFSEAENLYLLCYCIMDNHAHFLIYTEDISELSKAMSKINCSFAQFYNKKEDRVGYVFRNRYNSQEIKDEKHLYNTVAYIHRNPVKARIVKKMEQYPYSSYNYIKDGNWDKIAISLLFHEKNYIQQFDNIHLNFEEDDILEIKENLNSDEDINNFLNEFCIKNNTNIDRIKNDNHLLNMIVSKIKERYLVTNKQIAEVLGIGKNRLGAIKKHCN